MCEFVFRYFTINRMRISFIVRYVYTYEEFAIVTEAFIQSDLQYIQVMHVPWEFNPQPFVLLTQCSTTEPQEHSQQVNINT